MADNEFAKYLSIYKKRKKEDDALGGVWPDSKWASSAGTGFDTGGGSGGGVGGVGNAGGYVPPSNALAAFAQGQIQPEPQQQEDQGSGGGGQPEGPAPGTPGELSDIMSINNPGISVATGMPLGAIAGMVGLSVTDAIADLIGSLTGGRTDRVSQSMADDRNTYSWSTIPTQYRGVSSGDYDVAPAPNPSPGQEDQDLADRQVGGQFGAPPGAPVGPPDGEGRAGGPGAPTAPPGSSYGGPSPGPGTGYSGPDPSSPDGAAGGEGGSATGDAAGCWAVGTPITLSDGSTKNIEDVTEGDQVQAFDERTGKPGIGTVTATMSTERGGLVEIDGETVVSDNHRVIGSEAGEGDLLTWVEIGHLKAGDHLLRADGSIRTIRKLERLDGSARVFNFSVMPFRTYVAADIRAHNIKSAGGEVYNYTGRDMDPTSPDDTIITAKTGERVIQEPAADYYGPQIMDAINAGEIPREMLEAALTGDGAEFTPRGGNALAHLADRPRGRNALADMAEGGDDEGAYPNIGPLSPQSRRLAGMRKPVEYPGYR